MFRHTVQQWPDREAVVSLPQGIRLTYAQLDAKVDDLARGLLAMGIAAGDRIGIWSTDNAEWIVIQLAAARLGTVLVNINPAYRISELVHALRLARVQTMITIPSFRSSDYVGMLCEACPAVRARSADALASSRLPDIQRLIVFDPENADLTERPAPGFMTWREVHERGEGVDSEAVRERAATVDPDDPVNIQFTSGTTGFPKAVVLTHHNIVNNGRCVGSAMGFTERDRLCVPVPFYHCFGMVVANLACLSHGAAIVIPSAHFEAGATLAAIQDERCTAMHGVPTMFTATLGQPDFDSYDLSSLRTGIMAGAPCPPALLHRVIGEMGCTEILIGYGETESSPVTHLTRPEDSLERRTETVGTNLPHQEVKIVDPETGAILPMGESGEVCFRGYHVMRGYFDQEKATRDVIDEAGWLHSGDLGCMDEEGYLCITGRLKDMIIRGGENIYPAEIEAFYCEHPSVREVAVFGVPHPRFGEEVAACIRLHDGLTEDPESLQEYARERISHFKVPRYVWIVDDFPMTVSGKIQKFRLRELAEGWLASVETEARSVT